jgi:hypothetical protein
MSKVTVKFATLASVMVLAATAGAQAADLGGNCCADLEERVAELEATTARKGNRKVSLTVSGFVNESVMYWDDGAEKNAYVVSNNNAATRMRFNGGAKITDDVSAGYLMEISWRYANSSNRNQNADFAGGNGNTIDIRHSTWFLDSKSLGRVWVGKTSGATDGITEISVAAQSTSVAVQETWNGNFRLRSNGVMSNAAAQPGNGVPAAVSSLTWNTLYNGTVGFFGEGGRNNVVKYVTPTFGGFVASASWGEDDRINAALRYAGVLGGFKIAAGIGYGVMTDLPALDAPNCANLASTGAGKTGLNATTSATNCTELGMSGGIMHIASGLFVDAAYGQFKDKNRAELYALGGYTKAVTDVDKSWYVRGGIEQKFFAIGKSTIFAEASKNSSGASLTMVPVAGSGAGAIRDVTGDLTLPAGVTRIMSGEVKMWGIGFNQEIAAAAMDMYVGYKNFSGSAQGDTTTGSATGTKSISFDKFQAVMAGAIIRF